MHDFLSITNLRHRRPERGSASNRALPRRLDVRSAGPDGQIWAGHFNSYFVSNLGTQALRSKPEDITMAQIGFDAGNYRPVFATGRPEPGATRLSNEPVKVGSETPPESASILNCVYNGISSACRVHGLTPVMGAPTVKSISENQHCFVPGEGAQSQSGSIIDRIPHWTGPARGCWP